MEIVSSFGPKIFSEITNYMVRLNWAQLETAEGVYDWTPLTEAISPFTSKGNKVAIVVSLASDSGPNVATPAYVLAKTPTVKCKAFPDPCPVTNSPFFVARQEALIAALLNHLEPQASEVLYVRVGPVHGGESCPSCFQANSAAWGGQSGFMGYLSGLASFVAALKSPVRMVYNFSACISEAWAIQMGGIFAGASLGIGNDAASGKDSLKSSNGDWVGLFAKYPDVYHYLQLQSPDTVEDLLTIVPFARANGCNAFEIPESMLDVAYDPSNPQYTKLGAQLRSVLEAT